ncbi:uncharacterized protein DNG_00163 [Cephalotrichum gorgonifer]|uniref:Rhodopsin domain-containing protein n=1 Tax=Cephalotrichum gorgonifer TaxID=2041049 RepID=A0AAE8MPH8_9PEZI|nr:uncharacterized protein DNG_00163 [Cephalotrichum gorgonifer]
MSKVELTPEELEQNNGPYLIITIWTVVGIASIFLALRLWCKIKQSRGLWWDDHVLVASWVAIVLANVFSTLSVHNGYGRHYVSLSDAEKRGTMLYYEICSSFSITASSWSKTSFAITILRLAKGRRLTWFIWFLIISVNLTKAVSATVGWLGCTPMRKAWDPTVVGGHCWDGKAAAHFNMFSGVYSGFMDCLLAILPWPIVLTLQMQTREKFGVALAMSMGVLAGATAFIKCAKIPLLVGADFNFKGWELVAWGVTETAVTIIAASIPVLRVLVRRLRSSAGGRYDSPGGYCVNSDSTTAHRATAMHGAVITISGGKGARRWGECSESMRSFELAEGVGSKIVRTSEVRIEVGEGIEEVGEVLDDKVAETSWPR